MVTIIPPSSLVAFQELLLRSCTFGIPCARNSTVPTAWIYVMVGACIVRSEGDCDQLKLVA